MVSLKGLIKKREAQEQVKQERKQYKKQFGKMHNVDLPVHLWTARTMLDYFLRLKKKRGLKLTEVHDTRSTIMSLAAIKRSQLNGVQWVEFTNWLETEVEGLSTIWFAIKKIPDFKKQRSDLFNDGEFEDVESD